MDREALKKMLDDMLQMIDSSGTLLEMEEGAVAAMARVELLNFMLCLLAQEGDVTEEEASFVGEMIGVSATAEEVMEILREQTALLQEFGEEVSPTLVSQATLDNAMDNEGLVAPMGNSEVLVLLYFHLGMSLMSLREEALPGRMQWAMRYFDMQKNYLDRSLDRRKNPEKYNIPKM